MPTAERRRVRLTHGEKGVVSVELGRELKKVLRKMWKKAEKIGCISLELLGC